MLHENRTFSQGKSFYCLTPPTQPPCSYAIMELKQQPWQRLRKHHLKSEFVLPQTSNFLVLNSKGLYIKVQEKKKKVVVLCSPPRQNVKLGIFMSWSCSDS